uniref:Uncharacterized protein n=1 Tax=Anguilla anguilla TaxID=7936 RepID=A0A0E9T205_ANGAN
MLNSLKIVLTFIVHVVEEVLTFDICNL